MLRSNRRTSKPYHLETSIVIAKGNNVQDTLLHPNNYCRTRPGKLDTAKQKLGELCHAVKCDVSDLSSIPAFMQNIYETYGPIDILVNNTGTNMKREMTAVTDEEFQETILTNLTAVFTMSREVVKCMLKHEGGNIINISSMAAQYGIPKVIAYSES